MSNPAAVAAPVEDVQGDGRWMSMVSTVYIHYADITTQNTTQITTQIICYACSSST